jgi:hypothetical protein
MDLFWPLPLCINLTPRMLLNIIGTIVFFSVFVTWIIWKHKILVYFCKDMKSQYNATNPPFFW